MRCDATRVDFPVQPFGQTASDLNQWTMFIQPPAIDRALRCEGVHRCGYEYVVAHELDR